MRGVGSAILCVLKVNNFFFGGSWEKWKDKEGAPALLFVCVQVTVLSGVSQKRH